MSDLRRGFTIVELVIALIIGGLLTSIAVNAFGSVQTRFAVRQARDNFVSVHARARAQAIEFGQTMELRVDVAGDSAYITRNDSVVDRMRFGEVFGVDITGNTIRLCMSPRGYADLSCNNFTSTQTLKFKLGTDSLNIQILPMGQLVY